MTLEITLYEDGTGFLLGKFGDEEERVYCKWRITENTVSKIGYSFYEQNGKKMDEQTLLELYSNHDAIYAPRADNELGYWR